MSGLSAYRQGEKKTANAEENDNGRDEARDAQAGPDPTNSDTAQASGQNQPGVTAYHCADGWQHRTPEVENQRHADDRVPCEQGCEPSQQAEKQ